MNWRVTQTMVPETLEKILRNEMVIFSKSPLAKVKWKANRCNRLEEHIQLAFKACAVFPFPWITINPSQIREEITELLRIVARRKPMSVLEIGTAGGGTLFLFTRVSSPEALIISVDLPGGRFGGGYSEWRVPLYRSFATFNQDVRLLRQNSHSFSTLKMVESLLGRRKLDFLFIDGDHTYKGARMDFEMYSPLVANGGIIAFHDIVPGPSEKVGSVPRFWNEIKNSFSHVELVKNWKQSGFGIGVLYL